MIGNIWKSAFKICAALYICFNFAGCATPAALEYAEKQANEPPTYRSITDVYFAALNEPDQLRLCVLSRADSTTEPAPATLEIDLEKLSKSITDGNLTKHDKTSLAYNSIGAGSKLRNKCEPVLQGAEKLVPIDRRQVESTDFTSAIQQLTPEELTVFVLDRNGMNHIVIGTNDQDFPGINNEQFNAQAEDNASKAGYALVPLAVVADAVIAAGVIIVGIAYGAACVFGGGSCNF